MKSYFLPKTKKPKEIKVLSEFLHGLMGDSDDKWDDGDFKDYNALVGNGKYVDGIHEGLIGEYNIKILTFQEFERLILNKEIEPQYEIY